MMIGPSWGQNYIIYYIITASRAGLLSQINYVYRSAVNVVMQTDSRASQTDAPTRALWSCQGRASERVHAFELLYVRKSDRPSSQSIQFHSDADLPRATAMVSPLAVANSLCSRTVRGFLLCGVSLCWIWPAVSSCLASSQIHQRCAANAAVSAIAI